jgi:hypothetical protein
MSCLGSEIRCQGNHRNSVWSRVKPRQHRVKPRQLFLGGGFLPRPNTLMLASDSSRREFASSWIALSSANAAPAAVRGWAWTGCRFLPARKMELGDGGVRLWSRCHLQIAALRSFGDIRSASGMASRASRIPRSTGVRPIASTPRAPREARGNLGVLPACRLASLSISKRTGRAFPPRS